MSQLISREEHSEKLNQLACIVDRAAIWKKTCGMPVLETGKFITMNKVAIAIGLLAAVTLAGCDEARQSNSVKVQRFSEIELYGPMPKAFRDFVEHVDPYGALYVTETGGGGGRIGGQPSLEVAKKGALAHREKS